MLNMQKWLIPSNIKRFDVVSHFEENDRIDWIINRKWEIGDIVYIYVSNPVKKVMCKTIIEKEVTYDGDDEKYACLHLMKKIDCEELSYKNLLKHGLKGPLLGPKKLDGVLEEYIEKCFDNDCEFDKPNLFSCDKPRNIIYFGAPGTGKSHNLDSDKDNLLNYHKNNYERVTFHPDYSYANFVGTYKPVPDKKTISYEYIPGPFMRLLVKSLKKPEEPFLLLIEEINRANAAAVFGDVFQLLDRDDEDYVSKYPIHASEDMKKYLEDNLGEHFEEIKIPQNMFIWATMNSADQGVFPLDTAFKRRWDFKYFPINPKNNEMAKIEIDVDESWNLKDNKLNWDKLRQEINSVLSGYGINEDKLIGPYYAFDKYIGKDKIPINDFKDIFKNKILMYLYEDVARSKRPKLFAGVNGDITYSQIRDEFESRGIRIFCDTIRDKFLVDNNE